MRRRRRMAIKTTHLWGIILVSVSSACDQLRLPKTPESATSAQSASGQTPPKPAPRPAPARAINAASEAQEAAAFDGIRTGLRRLVVAEETFFAENGTYTNDLDRLQYKAGPGNSVRFLWMSGTGWAASGTHDGVTGKDCVIYVGRDRGAPTTLKYVRKGKEGVPVCDTSPRAGAACGQQTSRRGSASDHAAGHDHAVDHDADRDFPRQQRARHIQRSRRSEPGRRDEGGPPQPGAVTTDLFRATGSLCQEHRAVRAPVPLAPRSHDHDSECRCRVLVRPGDTRRQTWEELRDLVRPGPHTSGDVGR